MWAGFAGGGSGSAADERPRNRDRPWLERDQSGNSQAAALANAALEGVADRVTLETADMRHLPFPADSFDVSHWAVHNLEQRSDRVQALEEMVRVLRPTGAILLTDIANRSEYKQELERLGLSSVRVVIDSGLRDRINHLVSFGSFRPATIVAKKR